MQHLEENRTKPNTNVTKTGTPCETLECPILHFNQEQEQIECTSFVNSSQENLSQKDCHSTISSSFGEFYLLSLQMFHVSQPLSLAGKTDTENLNRVAPFKKCMKFVSWDFCSFSFSKCFSDNDLILYLVFNAALFPGFQSLTIETGF